MDTSTFLYKSVGRLEVKGMSGIYARVKSKLLTRLLSKLARTVKREDLTYLSDSKLFRLESALRTVRSARTDGAFLEFGVALGGSAILIANAAAQTHRPFFGLDVFRLIPPPSSDKDDDNSKERFRAIASGNASGIGGEIYYGYRRHLYDEVVQAFRRHGLVVDGQRISLLKGLFEKTWSQVGVRAIAFCHIDCDWYDPVKFCLEQVAPRLSSNGIIVIDDYHDYGGCLQATNEFLKAFPEFELLDGPNVLVRRRNP